MQYSKCTCCTLLLIFVHLTNTGYPTCCNEHVHAVSYRSLGGSSLYPSGKSRGPQCHQRRTHSIHHLFSRQAWMQSQGSVYRFFLLMWNKNYCICTGSKMTSVVFVVIFCIILYHSTSILGFVLSLFLYKCPGRICHLEINWCSLFSAATQWWQLLICSLMWDHFHVFVKLLLGKVLTGCVPGAGSAVLPVCVQQRGSAVQSEPHLWQPAAKQRLAAPNTTG